MIEVERTPDLTDLPACDFCKAVPARFYSTAEGNTITLCEKCKANWTCSMCGKVSESIGGASYNAHDASGTVIWSGKINHACESCCEQWMREQKAKWEK